MQGSLVGAGFRWTFRIAGNIPITRDLASGMPDIAILTDSEDERPDEYFWTSAHLQELNTVQEVEDRTFGLKALFDAALMIYQPGYRPLEFEALFEWVSGKAIAKTRMAPRIGFPAFSPITLKEPMFADTKYADGSGKSILLSRTDRDVSELLRFLGHNGPTWISLYAIYEIVSRRWDKADLSRRGLGSAAIFRNFTRTANNGEVLGPFGRHAEKEKEEPPPNPMSYDDARNLIFQTAHAFLNEKAKSAGI